MSFSIPRRENVKFIRIDRWAVAFFPVIFSEEEGIVVDDICPMKNTISKRELNHKGKILVNLLQQIDLEAEKKNWVLFCHKG